MSMPTSPLLVAVCCAVVATSIGRTAVALEEPAYEVVETADGVELRRYAAYLVAETEVTGDFSGAGNAAFRRLFAYISGDNRSRSKIAMTAPVVQEPAGERIAMTAPVVQEGSDGLWRVGFVVPSTFDRDTVPEPTDDRVAIREVPARLVAAARFSGRWRVSRFGQYEAVVRDWIAARGYEAAGPAVTARYDPPFKPWFMRRNEVLVPVRIQGDVRLRESPDAARPGERAE